MSQIIIDIDEDLSRWLKSEARRRGVSVNRVARDALALAKGRPGPYPQTFPAERSASSIQARPAMEIQVRPGAAVPRVRDAGSLMVRNESRPPSVREPVRPPSLADAWKSVPEPERDSDE